MVEISLNGGAAGDDYDMGSFHGSNSLILPAKKSIDKKQSSDTQGKSASKKKKPLSSSRRKKLEKKNVKRAKEVDRDRIISELKTHQLTQQQKKQMVSVVQVMKKKDPKQHEQESS